MGSKVVIAGGTGYIGRHLTPRLESQGFEVVTLTRAPRGANEISWDGRTLGAWATALEGAAAVINLSGLSVGKHWSDENKLAMQESRLLSTRVIGEAISKCAQPPACWINASATGIYGDRGDEVLTEQSPPGAKGDFLVDLCVAWEDEFFRAAANTRKVCMRTGVVFGRDSLAFRPMFKAAQFFVGGHLGSGRQYMSWIHMEDLMAMYVWALEAEISGVVNAVSTEPVRNEELMRMLRAILRRPWAPPVPAFVLKLITLFGGPEASLILDSERVMPQVALDRGFEFRFPRLREALVDLSLKS